MVDIDCTAAGFTGPAFPLALHERTDPVLFDRPQVVEHAHVISRSIPLVELFQPPAREITAVMGIFSLYVFTGRQSALSAATAVCVKAAAAPVLLPQIG